MRIFDYNPGILDLDRYYNDIENDERVNGIFINVLLDTNLDLKVYLPDTNTYLDFKDFLDKFRNSKKIIILNLLLGYQLLNDKTAFDIANFNRIFVEQVTNLIGNYQNTFYIATISTSTLYFLKLRPLQYKIGTIITRADLGFIDVDFYIFSEYFINIEFINTLLARNKMVMIFPDTSNNTLNLPDNIKNNIDYIV